MHFLTYSETKNTTFYKLDFNISKPQCHHWADWKRPPPPVDPPWIVAVHSRFLVFLCWGGLWCYSSLLVISAPANNLSPIFLLTTPIKYLSTRMNFEFILNFGQYLFPYLWWIDVCSCFTVVPGNNKKRIETQSN